MTNAEARFNKSLRPRKPEGSLGRTAQDVHLDSHTAPELWFHIVMWRNEDKGFHILCFTGIFSSKAQSKQEKLTGWLQTEDTCPYRMNYTKCWHVSCAHLTHLPKQLVIYLSAYPSVLYWADLCSCISCALSGHTPQLLTWHSLKPGLLLMS